MTQCCYVSSRGLFFLSLFTYTAVQEVAVEQESSKLDLVWDLSTYKGFCNKSSLVSSHTYRPLLTGLTC